MKWEPLCNMLIDQGRFIGEDPIGHACGGNARWETKAGYLVCDQCKEMLEDPERRGRLTFPSKPFGVEEQKEIIEKAIDKKD